MHMFSPVFAKATETAFSEIRLGTEITEQTKRKTDENIYK